jgi:hypothetical protein
MRSWGRREQNKSTEKKNLQRNSSGLTGKLQMSKSFIITGCSLAIFYKPSLCRGNGLRGEHWIRNHREDMTWRTGL